MTTTDVASDRTLLALLGHWATQRPGEPVLVDAHGTITWERLATDIASLRAVWPAPASPTSGRCWSRCRTPR